MQHNKYQEFMAEMFGTMFILLLRNGVNAMATLFNLGGYTNITFGWGLGVFLGILISNRITGAHLNPAITIALMLTKRFPAKKVPLFISAQMIGGFIGAALVYFFYSAKFQQVDPTLAHSAGIFTTFPAITTSFMPGFMAEIIATAILMFAIWALVKLNSPAITGISGAQANHAKKQTKNANHVIWNARIAGVAKLNNFISVAFLAFRFIFEDIAFP